MGLNQLFPILIPVLALLSIIFILLVLFLRYILTKNIVQATSHLQELDEDYTKKQAEAEKQLENAKKMYMEMINKAKLEGEEIKSKAIKEAEEQKNKILQEAREKSERLLSEAEKSCELLKEELNQIVEKKASEKACELIQKVLPEKFKQTIHSLYLYESLQTNFGFEKFHLEKDIKQVKITSAFPLIEEEKNTLQKKLEREIGHNVNLEMNIDPDLIAGIIITIGDIVIDGSLKYKIQKASKM